MTEPAPLPASPPAPPQAAPPAAPAAAAAGERHVSAVAGKGASTKRQGTALVVAVTGAAPAFVLLRPQGQAPAEAKPDDSLRVQDVSRYEPPLPQAIPIPLPMPRPLPITTPPPIPAQQTPLPGMVQQPPPDPLAKARHAPLLA